MSERNYEKLRLGYHLSFHLYVASKELVRRARPYLDEMDLTYTQYLVLVTLWEHGRLNVKELGKKLYLDSGTLTPVLKNLEAKGFVLRSRGQQDERMLFVELTEKGRGLRDSASGMLEAVGESFHLEPGERESLCDTLDRLLKDEG